MSAHRKNLHSHLTEEDVLTATDVSSHFQLETRIVVTSTRDVANPDNLRDAVFGSELYLLDPAYRFDEDNPLHPQRLTNNSYSDLGGSLSPDGKKIIFESNELRADLAVQSTWLLTDLFVMDVDGSNRTLLTRGNSTTWSPDGKDIIFHASDLYYDSGGLYTGVPARPDPGAATRDSDLFLANVDDLAFAPDVLSKTQLVTNITNTPTIIEDDPDWSAANGLVVFTARPAPLDPNTPVNFNATEIYVMDPLHPELEPLRLTRNFFEERAVDWSPDGTQIAFSARIPEGPGNQEGEICVMNLADGIIHQLTSNTFVEPTVHWSPDGTQLTFQRNFSPFNWEIFTMTANPDGTFTPNSETQLTDTRGLNSGGSWGEIRTKVDKAVPGDGANETFFAGSQADDSIQTLVKMAKFEGTVSEHIQDVFLFNNAGQMGTERADDVTPGGERDLGQFGQAQSDFVAQLNSDDNPFPGQPHYGEWLQEFFFV
jgi:Tol biopolymer transport system component